jgi:hypothetical protein
MRVSLLAILGLPQPFGFTLLGLGLILTLAPYMGGADFGLFKVPTFSLDAQRRLRFLGPVFLIATVVLHLPIILQPNALTSLNAPATPVPTTPVNPDLPAGPRRGDSIACRLVILEPTDYIFGGHRMLEVTIDNFEFRFSPDHGRSVGLFVMKGYDAGEYHVGLRSTWPLSTPGWVGEHRHEGRIAIDHRLYYLLTPEERPELNSFGSHTTWHIPVTSKPLSRNEYEVTLARYGLEAPECTPYGTGVSLVDTGYGAGASHGILFMASVVVLLVVSGLLGLALMRFHRQRLPKKDRAV